MIRYLRGDATSPQAAGPKIIAHIVNTAGKWGKGFVLALSKRWPDPEREYRRWYNVGTGFELGATQIVACVKGQILVANMIAQKGTRTGTSGPPIRYDALRSCLQRVAMEAELRGASIHMPKIGTGLAGGDWRVIEPMIQEMLSNHSVFIYLLE